MDSPYNVEEWMATTAAVRRVAIFNSNYRMTGTELKGWDLVNTVPMHDKPGADEIVYVWEKRGSGGREMIRISIAELGDRVNALHALKDTLDNAMHPQVPRSQGKLARSGDIMFAERAPDAGPVAAVYFTVGNVEVGINSVGDKEVDVSAAAAMLGEVFSAPPKPTAIKSKRAHPMPAKRSRSAPGEPAVLIDKLPEPGSASGWVKVIAPGGELKREGDSLVYVASAGDSKEVEGFVMMVKGEGG